ncbi:MAG: energy-coupling factor transporter transmembrane protein EcfT [Methanomicrobia archaeon]|nr:energy-coupling factor transporter transmembrane protein EcfT [Methanomicrobia archaeon]
MIRYTMFLRRKSILHSIDPRSKIILSLFLFVVCIFFNNPFFVGTLFFSLIIFLKIFGKVEIRKTLSFLKPMLPFVIMIMLLWILLGSEKGNVIYQIWKLKIKDVNIAMAFAMGFRVLAMILSTFLLLMTTEQRDLVLALVKMKLPYDYGLTIAIALRYVPTLASLAVSITDAQKARGLELEKGNILEKIRKYIPILVPLIVKSIQLAQELAIAIETRAFGKPNRTFYRDLKFKFKDLVFLFAAVIFFVICLYLRIKDYGTLDI